MAIGHWLHDGPHAALAPKAAALAHAAGAGLPVPRGLAIDLDATLDAPLTGRIAELLAEGPVLVRSALAGEDDASHSGAGLGISIGNCRSAADVHEAIAALRRHRDEPLLARYFGERARDQVIVQRQIAARELVVAAVEPAGPWIEVHAPGGDPLATGATPHFAGAPSQWPDPAAPAVHALLDAAVRTAAPSVHGHDLEIVVDDAQRPWLVQLRPLVAPLHPGWPAFFAELERRGETAAMRGTLVLDAEHNPAPLSPAHASLVQWLAAQRPAAGGLVVLAGWLYTRTLVRDLAGTPTAAPPDVRAVLRRLHDEVLPAARARLSAIRREVAAADAAGLVAALERAHAAFLAMIDVYLGELIPARRGHASLAPQPDDPLCLRDRSAYLDVIPAAWDVASPLLVATPADRTPVAGALDLATLDEASAATLLREWDDHLFALGLAPVRTVLLAAGERLGLGDDVFLLAGPEVVAALQGRAGDLRATIAARREDQRIAAGLQPPPTLVDGRPGGTAAGRLAGIPIGPSRAGPIAQRRDLADLQRRPPPPGAIVVVPALTAQAALVVHALGLQAIVCEWGGALSHAALIARELGLCALVGCRGATAVPEGTAALVDTRAGRLRLAAT